MDLQAVRDGRRRTIASLALVAVALVWLIACANASNLLIARVTSRRRELSVRVALGASRERVVRYLLTESSCLRLARQRSASLLAWVGVGLLRDFGAAYFPRTAEIRLDGSVRWLLVGLDGGERAALRPRARDPRQRRPRRRGATGVEPLVDRHLGVRRLRRVLVASQFAIATPLLVVAGLLLASLNQLGRVALGFDTHNVLTGSILLPTRQYPEPRIAAFWDELQRRAESIPGVSALRSATGVHRTTSTTSTTSTSRTRRRRPGGRSRSCRGSPSRRSTFTCSASTCAGTAARQARRARVGDGEQPVVVDRAWVRRFFPNRDVLGRRMKEGGCTACPWTVVVGVVSDVKYAGLDKPNDGSVYGPLNPQGRSRYVVVRTRSDPSSVVARLRETVRELDANLPLSDVATIDELVERSLVRPRSLSLLVSAVAVVALLLSVIGIYGVMAYYVQQHAKDIGVRLALGGSRGGLFRSVVGHGMAVVLAGVVIGALASLALARAMSTLLFGVSAADPATFVAVLGLLGTAALAACALPAWRAVGVEPASVLRQD